MPLLNAATLEEDDNLQDIWARMLVNATNADHPRELTQSFIVILEQLTSLEMTLLVRIYAIELPETMDAGVYTANLPATASIENGNTIDWTTTMEPSDQVCLGLANLARLGLIQAAPTLGGSPWYRLVHRTILGEALMSFCMPAP